MKYFSKENLQTIDTLKKRYKELAFKLHPDAHPTATAEEKEAFSEQMKELNSEYEQAIPMVGKNCNKEYQVDNYPRIIEDLIKLNLIDVVIEICGWFIYLSGNTKPYSKQFKLLGYRWNPAKQMWYKAPEWWKKTYNKTWSMEEIRNAYGSQKYNSKFEEENLLKQS